MSNSFDKYLNTRRSKLTQNLTKKLQEKSRKGFEEEEGFWRPTSDKSGNGWAIIRFLPPGGDEEDSYVHYYEYHFQGPTGQWYIEKSRNSLGKDEPDPCQEFVHAFWAAKDEENAKKYPRRQVYIANVLVVKDPEHPENDGKVFKFKYGAQIAQKIDDALVPKIPGDPVIDAFDMLEGANFKLIIARKDKYPTYENSKFDNPSPVHKKTEEMAKILDQCYPLAHYVSEEKFKPYDVLKKRLEKVLGKSVSGKSAASAPKTEAPDLPKDDSNDELLKNLDSDDNESLDSILENINVE